MSPLSSPSPSPASAPRAKATLFCPACGHESSTDGDWEFRTSHRDVAVHCPDCGTRVTDRSTDASRSDAPQHSTPTDSHRAVAASGTPLGRWLRSALALAAWPCSATLDLTAARTR